MVTFIIGLVMLFGGAALYGKLCEKVFGPDDRKTPAYTKNDGVDYVPMKGWKNSLINLLNIAGTGPILGPIQGILFGPIAFITIPIGNVIGGAMHDYFSGMICLRDGGTQMPDMVKRYTNKGIFTVYNIFVCLLLLLVGAVFIYTPGDIAATQVFNFSGAANATSTWVIYGVIFVYYLVATVFPIDKIIGRIYPIFGGILLFSAIGVFIGLFVKGYPLVEVWNNVWEYNGVFNYSEYFANGHFFPIFFVTVACGILSGFHSTQTAIISRTMKSERQGRNTFYNMMILEGFIAMVWAAGAMGVYNLGRRIPRDQNRRYSLQGYPWQCRRHYRSARRYRSAHHLRRHRAARTAHVGGRHTAHQAGLQRQAPCSVGNHLRPRRGHPRLGEVQPRRLHHSVALLRVGKPDSGSVRVRLHLRLDV